MHYLHSRTCLNFTGQFVRVGVWDKSAELISSAVVAILLGLVLSYFMRSDSFFNIARRLNLTNKTPYPSEWYGAFAKRPRYIVLHLTGERRISGYPREWPTATIVGHFRLINAAWINDENVEEVLDGDESILIEAKQVEMVEFLKDIEEINDATKATRTHLQYQRLSGRVTVNRRTLIRQPQVNVHLPLHVLLKKKDANTSSKPDGFPPLNRRRGQST